MTISVVVLTYNEAAYIGACLDALIPQAHLEQILEVIVVDGGSTDGTLEEVDKRRPHSTKLRLLTQVGRGISAARNTGISAANGDWVLFVDADARPLDGYLESYVEAASMAGPRGGLLYGDALPDPTKWFERLCYAAHYHKAGPHGANICYRKEALLHVGCFDLAVVGRGDEIVVNTRILAAGWAAAHVRAAQVQHPPPRSLKEYAYIRYFDGHALRKVARAANQPYPIKPLVAKLFCGMLLVTAAAFIAMLAGTAVATGVFSILMISSVALAPRTLWAFGQLCQVVGELRAFIEAKQ